MPPAALIAGAAISAGAGLWSASKQADAARDAANIQATAARDASDMQMKMFNQTRSDLAPWQQAGTTALGRLSSLAGNQTINAAADPRYAQVANQAQQVNPAGDPRYQALQNQMTSPFAFSTTGSNVDPSYQWRLQQGQRALENSAAARGGFFSGGMGTALQEYGQGMASQEYQNQFNRYLQDKNFDLNAYQAQVGNYSNQQQFTSNEYQNAWNRGLTENQNTWNQLSSLSNAGQNAAAQVGQQGMQAGQQVGQNTMNAGQGQGQGLINQANAWSGGVQNVANQIQGLAGQYANYNMMNPASSSGGSANMMNYSPTNYGNMWGNNQIMNVDTTLPTFSQL